MPDELCRPEQGADRLSIYAGWLDIVNVTSNWNHSLELTKFAALFYKWIILPDGFFHTYGPLSEHLQNEASHIGYKLPAASHAAMLRLLTLLRDGVLVPAIRQGDSL